MGYGKRSSLNLKRRGVVVDFSCVLVLGGLYLLVGVYQILDNLNGKMVYWVPRGLPKEDDFYSSGTSIGVAAYCGVEFTTLLSQNKRGIVILCCL